MKARDVKPGEVIKISGLVDPAIILPENIKEKIIDEYEEISEDCIVVITLKEYRVFEIFKDVDVEQCGFMAHLHFRGEKIGSRRNMQLCMF